MKKLAYSNRWILSKQKGVILKQNQKTSTSIAKKKIKQVSKQTKTIQLQTLQPITGTCSQDRLLQ